MLNSDLDSASPPAEQTPPKKSQRKRTYDQKVHGKRYSMPTQIAIKAMANSGMTITEVAKQAGASRVAVYRIWEDPELKDLSQHAVNETKKGLSGLFYKRALEATKRIDADKLSQASALQLATVAGIMTEKGRLMEGLSTQNLTFGSVLANIDGEMSKISNKLGELGDDNSQVIDTEPQP